MTLYASKIPPPKFLQSVDTGDQM